MAGGKTKSGRALNPADAFRKEQRKKEVARNRMERKFIRESGTLRTKPEELKKQLQEIIDMEEDGPLPKNLKLKKKALQEAYDQALKRRKEEELRAKTGGVGPQLAGPGATGAVALRPEDSPYYHPTLNPTGAPPPGKQGALAPQAGAKAPSMPGLPVPKPPPLPAGPKPGLPPPPAAPPLPKSLLHSWLEPPENPLPPPAGPPPPVLPPPDIPPPGFKLPPPPMPPPGALPPPPARLPPPSIPPPGAEAAPGTSDEDAAGAGPGSAAAAGTASGAPAAAAAAAPSAAPLPPPPGPPPSGVPPPPPPGGIPPPPPHLPHMGFMPPPGIPPPPPMFAPPMYQGMRPGLAPGHYASAPVAALQPPKKDAAAATITGASTVVKRPLAQNDKTLTSMVPAALRVRREEAPKPKRPNVGVGPGSGFGLAPTTVKPAAAPAKSEAPASVDEKYLEFLSSVADLGAFE